MPVRAINWSNPVIIYLLTRLDAPPKTLERSDDFLSVLLSECEVEEYVLARFVFLKNRGESVCIQPRRKYIPPNSRECSTHSFGGKGNRGIGSVRKYNLTVAAMTCKSHRSSSKFT